MRLRGSVAILLTNWASCQQAALTVGGLAAVVQSDQRGTSLFSRNKEGVLSIPGYWALHLLSAGLGHWIRSAATAAAAHATAASHLRNGSRGSRLSLRPLYGWLAAVSGVGIALDGFTVVVAAAVEPVSRRACNAAYVVWMLAFNTQARSGASQRGFNAMLHVIGPSLPVPRPST